MEKCDTEGESFIDMMIETKVRTKGVIIIVTNIYFTELYARCYSEHFAHVNLCKLSKISSW